jgi:hypothetical protein
MIAPPVRYSPDVEQVQPDEDATVGALCRTFDTILATTSKNYGHAVRGVHAKSHGVLEGLLRIDDGLPPELAQGLFAAPGEHKVYLRLSTNPGDILPDTISLPRGLALKVLDVAGERLPGAEGTTQDFLMLNAPVFPAKNAKQFAGNLALLAGTTDRIEGVKVALSAALRGVRTALDAVGVKSSLVRVLGGAPNVEPLGETYFSVTPFRYGDYIAKFSLAPATTSLTALTGKEIDASQDRDAIRARVREEMGGIDAVWELRVQLCRDLQKQPIEDATVEWKADEAPFQRVGIINAHRQDSWAPERVQAVDETMRFSVWTGLAAHQPLGSINRARKATYRHSAAFREHFNRCPIHEPVARN